MRIDILTLFPQMYGSPLSYSILKRAQEKAIVQIHITNIRDFSTDPHKKVDDKPYGGGAGMVMMPGPVFACCEYVEKLSPEKPKTILLTPQGRRLNQKIVRRLSKENRLMLITGRYEGFDERIRIGLNAEQLSIGDYVLSGGELPAMVLIDAVVRLLPGALGGEDSTNNDSFSRGLLEYPHYTRPEVFREMKVPDVLLSGNHAEIRRWREKKALERTQQSRPNLLKNRNHPKNP